MPQLPNIKHERFCQAVIEGETFEKAYIIAGYSRSYSNAHRLFNSPQVVSRIEELRALVGLKHDMTRSKLMEAYIEIATFDPRALFKWDEKGTCVVKSSDELPVEVARMVEEVQVKADGTMKLKWAKRTDALDQIGRMLGAFKDKIEVKDVTPREDDASNIELARRAAFMLGRAVERMTQQHQQQSRVIDAAPAIAGTEPV